MKVKALLLTLLMPAAVMAEDYTVKDGITYSLTDTGTATITHINPAERIIIPESVEIDGKTYPVNTISYHGYEGWSYTVKHLAIYAPIKVTTSFSFPALETLYIGPKVLEIGEKSTENWWQSNSGGDYWTEEYYNDCGINPFASSTNLREVYMDRDYPVTWYLNTHDRNIVENHYGCTVYIPSTYGTYNRYRDYQIDLFEHHDWRYQSWNNETYDYLSFRPYRDYFGSIKQVSQVYDPYDVRIEGADRVGTGLEVPYKAVVQYSGKAITPTEWKVDMPANTINYNGIFVAQQAGVNTISAKLFNDAETEPLKVIAFDELNVEEITTNVRELVFGEHGTPYTFSYEYAPLYHNDEILITSSNENVCTVSRDNCTITPKNVGTATITLRSKRGDTKAEIKVEVVPKATSIVIDNPGQVMAGDAVQLTYTIEPAAAARQMVTWRAVYKETDFDLVTPAGEFCCNFQPGYPVRVYATCNSGAEGYVDIDVVPTKASGIELTQQEYDIPAMQEQTVTVNVTGNFLCSKAYKIVSDNPDIVDVRNSEKDFGTADKHFIGKRPGTATLTVTAAGNDELSATIKVTVNDTPENWAEISQPSTDLVYYNGVVFPNNSIAYDVTEPSYQDMDCGKGYFAPAIYVNYKGNSNVNYELIKSQYGIGPKWTVEDPEVASLSDWCYYWSEYYYVHDYRTKTVTDGQMITIKKDGVTTATFDPQDGSGRTFTYNLYLNVAPYSDDDFDYMADTDNERNLIIIGTRLSSDTEAITLPNSVVVNNVAYKVTGISNVTQEWRPDYGYNSWSNETHSNHPFAGFTELKQLTIPGAYTDLGTGTFNNCDKIDAVYCKGLTPPDGSDLFTAGVYSAATLYVPENAYSDYARHHEWLRFRTIEKSEPAEPEPDPDPQPDPDPDPDPNGISDVYAPDANAVFYDLQGNRILNPLAGQIYIILIDGKAQKVILQ